MKKLKAIGESVKYFLIFSVTPVICALIILLLYRLFSSSNISMPEISNYFVEIISCVLMLVIYYFILKVKGLDFTDNIRLKKITLLSAISYIFVGLSIYFVFAILLNYIPFLQGEGNAAKANDLSESVNGINIVFLFMAKCIAAPFLEEITFRGLIYSKLKEAFPRWISSFITSLVFAIVHFSLSIFTVIIAFFMGLFFNFLVDRYKSIIPGVLVHMSYNLVVTFIAYNINNIDFSVFEVPIVVVSIIIFVIAIIGVFFDIKKLNRKLESVNK